MSANFLIRFVLVNLDFQIDFRFSSKIRRSLIFFENINNFFEIFYFFMIFALNF